MAFRPPPIGRVTRRALAVSGMLIAAVGAGAATSIAVTAAGPRAEIEAALIASARGWSGGDLDGFMRVYEDSPETTYLKSDGVVRGFKAIHDMYAARFGGAPGGLGRLSLEVVAFRPLGPTFAEVIGRFALRPAKPGAEAAHGMFTLVFHHTPQGWKIASDHTS